MKRIIGFIVTALLFQAAVLSAKTWNVVTDLGADNTGATYATNLTCMDGNYPDANKNGIANAYGIWARGLDGPNLINCKFYDDGGSKREKFVFYASTAHINTNAK